MAPDNITKAIHRPESDIYSAIISIGEILLKKDDHLFGKTSVPTTKQERIEQSVKNFQKAITAISAYFGCNSDSKSEATIFSLDPKCRIIGYFKLMENSKGWKINYGEFYKGIKQAIAEIEAPKAHLVVQNYNPATKIQVDNNSKQSTQLPKEVQDREPIVLGQKRRHNSITKPTQTDHNSHQPNTIHAQRNPSNHKFLPPPNYSRLSINSQDQNLRFVSQIPQVNPITKPLTPANDRRHRGINLTVNEKRAEHPARQSPQNLLPAREDEVRSPNNFAGINNDRPINVGQIPYTNNLPKPVSRQQLVYQSRLLI
jgi:hypothetical protein